MRTKLILWILAVTLTVMIALPTLAGPTPKPAQPAAPAGQGLDDELARHPNYRDAMLHLQNAKTILDAAHEGWGGHRQRAEEHVKAAIFELEEALRFGQAHGQ